MERPGGEKPSPPQRRPAGLAAGDVAAIGLIATPILVNLLGYLLFAGHPLYGPAQGLGTLFFFLGLLTAPLGAVYWGLAAGLIAAGRRRGVSSRRSAWWAVALAYAALVLAVVLWVGWAR